MKRTLALLLTLLLLVGSIPAALAVESPFEGVDVILDANGKVVDLGGIEVVYGDWWSSGVDEEPTTAQEEARQEWRTWIQETYNFKIKQVAVASWEDSPQVFTNFATTGGDENYAFVLRSNVLAAPMKSKLFYDLATLDCLDFSQEKWNRTTQDLMTVGDSIYGMRPYPGEPRVGLFFNKRMLTEAGIDPESLYNMQADGTWTWEAFEAVCKQLTRDTNNDGVTDVYALTSFSQRLIGVALASNGAAFVGMDDSGKYVNTAESDAFLEAANWVVDIIRNYEMPQPEGSNWDYAEAAFYNGNAAMSVHEDYFASNLYQNMKDDYGFVMFPKGPRVDTYYNVWTDNVIVIPSNYDAERAWKIAFAFNLFTDDTPGYDDVDDWKTGYYAKYRDTRAVDETVAMMRSAEHGVTWLQALIPGYDLGPDFYYDVYAMAMTPAEKLESVRNQWQAYLDAANQ